LRAPVQPFPPISRKRKDDLILENVPFFGTVKEL
jgi:hypothetical protein